eukprot:TRINITY_DN8158_c0_g1_i1.p1 TRINITY_DN8158_c0_g1~~TRINITY_DN8158_c0_g1_i1.p1  ORF type:complete len:501 (+),score=75.35 TRINITY_DN8158_c0_g1_i1:73-1503(+)
MESIGELAQTMLDLIDTASRLDGRRSSSSLSSSSGLFSGNQGDGEKLIVKTPSGVYLIPKPSPGETIVIDASDESGKQVRDALQESGILEEGGIGKFLFTSHDTSKKFEHDGKKWDYMWKVKGDQGKLRVIACNKGDNPYVVADEFVKKETLPGPFFPRIAAYICQQLCQLEKDRFPILPQTKEFPSRACKHIPRTGTPIVYSKAQHDRLFAKLSEFNQALLQAKNQAALLPVELVLVQKIVTTLKDVVNYNRSNFTTAQYAVMVRVLMWPEEKLFPVLDLYRLFILHPRVAENFCRDFRSGQKLLFRLLRLLHADAPHANVMLMLKFVANMFFNDSLRELLIDHAELVLGKCAIFAGSNKDIVQSILANIILNYAMIVKKSDIRVKLHIFLFLEKWLKGDLSRSNEAVQFTYLVGLGSLLFDDWDAGHMAKTFEFPALTQRFPRVSGIKISETLDDLNLCFDWYSPTPARKKRKS